MNIGNAVLRKTLFVLLTILIFACGNNDAEMEKIKKENEELKNAQLKREQVEKKAQKAEKEALQKQITEEKAKTAQKVKKKESESIVKTGTVSVSIEVENYKPSGKKWDGTGAPDISGKITFPDGSTIIIQKHQNSYTANGSVENVRLQKNDKIEVFLEDRDMASHDNIASGSLVYPGGRIFKKSIGSAHLVFKFE